MRKRATTYGELVARLLADADMAAYRPAKKMTAYRLAKLAGVPQASVSLILSDQRKPSVETLERLLRAAGKEWAWLDENLVDYRTIEEKN